MKKSGTKNLTVGAFLIALGIVIPLMMPFPLKIQIGPASFTLASHVPVFVAIFFSPMVAVCVSLGTALGFLLSGMGPIVAARALSHVIFAVLAALYLQKFPKTVSSWRTFLPFNFVVGIIHAFCEMVVVYLFFFSGQMQSTNYTMLTIFLFLGIGGLIHSMIDCTLAYLITEKISHRFSVPVFQKAKAAQLKEKKEFSVEQTA